MFREEISLRKLKDFSEPIIDVCLIDMFIYIFKNKQIFEFYDKDKRLSKYQSFDKICSLVSGLISEKNNGFL